jgi:acyl-CoA thioester hydrolase
MPQGTCEVRVRYGETDQMGVAYYAHYLSWFEMGRSDLLRRLGMSYREMEAQAVFLPVVEAQCRYIKSARYDDLLRVTTRLLPPERRRLYFEYQVHRVDDQCLLATGTTLHVPVDASGKPRRLPDEWLRLLE